jgi:uncharacterized protein YdhG (YjbR/CyaY superfamily)
MTIDDYIAQCSPDAQGILERIRRIIRKAAPEAEERISYKMPAFALNGMLIYFAAFKGHIGIFPPIKGDAALQKDTAPYRGPKGNLKFPLDSPDALRTDRKDRAVPIEGAPRQKAAAVKKKTGKAVRTHA